MTVDPGWPVAVAVALLVAMTVGLYAVGRLPRPSAPVIAAGRAVLQLSVVALLITAVIGSLARSVALLVVMVSIATWTTARRIGAPAAWPWAAVSMLSGLVPVVAIILLTGTVPLAGISLIPVVGILSGNTMNAHSLVGRRAFTALREEKGHYEAALSIGLSRSESIDLVVHRLLPEALVPGMDQVRTVGVVTLPGAFIGVLLGGGSAVQAATAQVLVLVGIMAAQTATALVAEHLIRSGRLLPADLKASLQP